MALMVRPGQFSLRALFIATTFVALACLAARFVGSPWCEPLVRLLAWFALPVLIAGAVGAIRGRHRAWLGYGVTITIGLIAPVLLAALFGY
jgi:hypothetical protein